jgi:hypothetical protein
VRQYHRRCHRPVVAVTVAIAVAVTVAVAAVDITRCAALARAAAQITEAVREKETALRQLEDVKKGYADREVEMQRLRDEMASQEKAATLRTTTLAEKLHKMRVRAAVRVCVHVCMCVCSDVFADVSLCRRRWRRRRRSSRRRSKAREEVCVAASVAASAAASVVVVVVVAVADAASALTHVPCSACAADASSGARNIERGDG